MEVLSEEAVDQLAESEAIDEARDVVDSFEVRLQQLRSGNLGADEGLKLLSREASNLRLKMQTVAITGLAPTTHRLDDYLAGLKTIETQNIDDVQAFVDRISSLLDGEKVAVEEVAEVVRSLPRKTTFDIKDVTVTDTEVTLVIPQRAAARIVERELAECGYHVSTVLNPIEALSLIVETRPDMVITAQVMPRVTGVDLACALAAMPTTKDIPVALLTSLEPNHPDLAPLPVNVGLIRRGVSFGDDLAHVLERFKIT